MNDLQPISATARSVALFPKKIANLAQRLELERHGAPSDLPTLLVGILTGVIFAFTCVALVACTFEAIEGPGSADVGTGDSESSSGSTEGSGDTTTSSGSTEGSTSSSTSGADTTSSSSGGESTSGSEGTDDSEGSTSSSTSEDSSTSSSADTGTDDESSSSSETTGGGECLPPGAECSETECCGKGCRPFADPPESCQNGSVFPPVPVCCP